MRRGQTRIPEETHRNWIVMRPRTAERAYRLEIRSNVTQGLGPVDLWKYIKLVKAPTLYMVGANSNLVPRETQEQLKALPHIEVVTIPDAGHYPHLDTPVVWLAVVSVSGWIVSRYTFLSTFGRSPAILDADRRAMLESRASLSRILTARCDVGLRGRPRRPGVSTPKSTGWICSERGGLLPR